MSLEEPNLLLDSVEVPLLTITPLYCLVTDADEIVLTDRVTITRYSEEQIKFLGEDDRFVRHLRLYVPQCLLWERSSVSLKQFKEMAEETAALAAEHGTDNGDDIVRGADGRTSALRSQVNQLILFLRALQLYRRGRLVVGDSLFYFAQPLPVRIIARCTDMTVDYQIVEQYRPSYEFNSSDIRDFLIFYVRFLEVSLTIAEYQEIELAVARYCKEAAQHGDVVDLVISLESLLVPEDEGIAFKLSQRVANLLGTDASRRKELFKSVKDFYGLRSRTVHGAKVRPKEINLGRQLDDLREITRKIILSVMALVSESGMGQEFPLLLNDMCFDDDLRSSVQAKAAALLKLDEFMSGPA
jgi:hypothetical protein